MRNRFPFAALALLVSGLAWTALSAQQQPRSVSQPPATPAPGAAPTGSAASQAQEIVLYMPDGSVRSQIVLAFPPVTGLEQLPEPTRAAAHVLEETLRADLDRAGIFRFLAPEEAAVLTLTGEATHDYEQYRSVGAEMLLAAEAKAEGDRLVLEGRLIYLANGEAIVGKRYRGTNDLARRIAHTFSDEIVLFLTSKRGIALTSIAFYSDRDGEKEIYLMDYDGYDQRRITGHRSISMSPAWSPTGDAVAYVSFFAGNGPALYLADVASGRKSPLVTSGSLNTSPSFSPDGRRVVFARGLGANIEIFSARRDGSDLKRLTNSPGIDTNPSWSPSGNEIAFTSSRSGTPQIYVMDSEGANLRRVTFEGEYNEGAAWSPDGTRLVYATRVAQNRFDLALLDLVTLAAQRLTDGSGSNESPAFAPDGRRVVFTSTRAGGVQIFTMEPRYGSPADQLTRDGKNYAPDWSGYLP